MALNQIDLRGAAMEFSNSLVEGRDLTSFVPGRPMSARTAFMFEADVPAGIKNSLAAKSGQVPARKLGLNMH